MQLSAGRDVRIYGYLEFVIIAPVLAPPLGGSQCGRREPMGVTTWETSFVVYTELRLDAYESNATRGVIKMITHAATGCSKWDSASL